MEVGKGSLDTKRKDNDTSPAFGIACFFVFVFQLWFIVERFLEG